MNLRLQQQLDSLGLFLYDRPLHPELFEIFHDMHIEKPDYQARVWVTGLSHVISFHVGSATISEVVAPDFAELPKRGCRLRAPFGKEVYHSRKFDHLGISYMLSMQIEKMSEPVYRRTHHEMARKSTKPGLLFVPFPQRMEDSLTPFSYISHDQHLAELHVMTFHAFPHERTMVKTQSIFRVQSDC